MKKYIIASLSALAIACGSTDENAHSHHDHSHATHSHSHDAHSHDSHSHDAHSHAAHSHDSHSHHEHNHDAHAHDSHSHSHDAHSHNHADGDIEFTTHEASLGEFATEKVSKRDFSPIIKTAGRIISTPQGQHNITAPVSGTVYFRDNITEGTAVAASGTVMRISSDNIGGATSADIKANYELSKSKMERANILIADRIISQSHYDEVKAEYERNLAAYTSLQRKANNDISVKSSIAGYISDIAVENGDYVAKGEKLFSVIKNHRSRISIDIAQKHYGEMDNIASAVIVTPSGKAHDTATLSGRVVSYTKTVSDAGMLSMTMEYDAVEDMPQGSYADVYLRLKSDAQALAVPLSAITEEQGEYFVYVQTCAEHYRKQPVQIGHSDGIRIEIKKGLHAGETIVTRGTYRVKLAGNTGAIPHSHEH